MADAMAGFYERLQACEEQYALHFAGQLRLTRDPDMLSALIDEAATVGATCGDAALSARAAALADTYRHERDDIAAAPEAAGTAGRRAAALLGQVAAVMHRYTRHFAGAPRATRDTGLLTELRLELGALADALAVVSDDGARQTRQLRTVLDREDGAIAQSRAAGTPAQQAAAWAGACNTLLGTFSELCLERRRLAVRTGLLERLHDSLVTVRQEMASLQMAGLDLPHHAEAMEALNSQVAMWEQELAATRRAHEGAVPDDVVAALDAEIDDILSALNGGPDRSALRVLCDRMDECERALRGRPEAAAAHRVAADALAMLCLRYDGLPAEQS